MLGQLLGVMMPASVGVGVLVGALLGRWIPALYLSGAVAVFVAAAYAWLRSDRRWSLSNLECDAHQMLHSRTSRIEVIARQIS